MKYPPSVAVQCPICGDLLTIPIQFDGERFVKVTGEFSEVDEHIAAHVSEYAKGDGDG